MYLAKQFLQLRTNWYSGDWAIRKKKFQYFHQQNKLIYWSLFANSLWNKEVALNLAVERHLLARPSLATEMHKQKEKHAPKNKKFNKNTKLQLQLCKCWILT